MSLNEILQVHSIVRQAVSGVPASGTISIPEIRLGTGLQR